MQINRVRVITQNSDVDYVVGCEFNGVVIDDIIHNTETNVLFMYDELSNLLLAIIPGAPMAVEITYEVTHEPH